MGRIPEEDVQRVRDATDVVALVSESVVLGKKGRLLWGRCPFHQEKTPSFKVDPATQLWHCFGCGKGGDVFGYIMETERLEFPDAVRRLADRARVEIVEESGGLPAGHRERLMATMEAAAEFFHSELTTSKSAQAAAARAYLKSRGFGSEVAKRWRLGYAPPGRDRLSKSLLGDGFSAQELVDANVSMSSGPGAVRDRFFDRVMFPISDVSGRVIAFGGRVVGDGHPKYLNSQETAVFKKSGTLYALDRARNEIVGAETGVIVEGYTDVIALHEAGVKTAVATLGTALTDRHVKLLARFAKRVVYLFDGDEAGLRAAERAAEFVDWSLTPEAASSRVELSVALVPEGMDPADYVAAHGRDAIETLLTGAEPLLRFVIDRRLEAHDTSTPEGRAAALKDAAAVLLPVRESLLGQDYANHIADRLSTDVATVWRAIPAPRRGPASTEVEATAKQTAVSTPELRIERELLRFAVRYPQVRAEARELLSEGVVSDEATARVLEAVVGAGDSIGAELFARMSSGDPEYDGELTGWLVDAPEVEQVEYAFREVSGRLRDLALGRTIRAKKVELKALDQHAETEGYDRLFKEIAVLQRRQQAMREHAASRTDVEVE